MGMRKNIYVHPSCDRIDPVIREALARLEPVCFHDCTDMAACQRGDALISLSGDDEVLAKAARRGLRCFHMTNGVAGSAPKTGETRIRFGAAGHLDKLIRARNIIHTPLANPAIVPAYAGDEVLASCGDQPVWVRRTAREVSMDIVSVPLPKLSGAEQPFDYLDGIQFIQLLPVLHFLRQVTEDLAWTRPSLRAGFTFDDPNLHWPSYGHLSFQELVRLGKECNFHSSIATVPCDAWGANQHAVDLFKQNPKQLSLLIHGNNHLRIEVGRDLGSEWYHRLLAQSLRRIARLEQKTGLCVARVLVPPQEALAGEALVALRSLGFEGASLTPWSIRYWNPKQKWPATFGLEITEQMAGWSPVIPRFKLSDTCEGMMVVAAFLGRPIVAFGHHETVADGFDMIKRAAEVINSLGDVRWESPAAMLRSSFLSRREESTLRLKLHSSRIVCVVGDGVTSLLVDPPEGGDHVLLARIKKTGARGAEPQVVNTMTGNPINVAAGDTLELFSPEVDEVDFRSVPSPGYAPWALPRRLFCESRDRLRPMLIKLRRSKAVPATIG